MKKLKILYLITQSELGGAQHYVFDLAKNLSVDFDIKVAFGEPFELGGLAHLLKADNIEFFILKNLRREILPLNDILTLFDIVKLIFKTKPDILHLNSTKISILGSISGFVAKIFLPNLKIVYTAHGWVFNEPLPLLKKLFFKYSEILTSYAKDKIICVSEYDKQTGIANGINKKKLITVHNGIDNYNFINKDKAREYLKTEFRVDIKGSDILIGSIGNLYTTKGYTYLFKALSMIIRDFPNVKLIIMGNKKDPALLSLINKLNLSSHIILPGHVKNYLDILPALDIYVCSSLKEGLPYSIIEAMQAGIPIVSTNVGGIPEMIDNNINGLLVKPKDEKELAAMLLKLLKSTELKVKFAQNAKQKYQEFFNIDKMLQETKKIYTVLSNPN